MKGTPVSRGALYYAGQGTVPLTSDTSLLLQTGGWTKRQLLFFSIGKNILSKSGRKGFFPLYKKIISSMLTYKKEKNIQRNILFFFICRMSWKNRGCKSCIFCVSFFRFFFFEKLTYFLRLLQPEEGEREKNSFFLQRESSAV